MALFCPSCQVITKPGMVITVEPGIYLEGKFGVRMRGYGADSRKRM